MTPQYTIGLDYGTNSVRALVVNTDKGKEVGLIEIRTEARQ